MKYAELTPELERELAERYQAGDREAGAELLDAHWPILVRLMRRLFRRGVDDADVMQTACVEFLDRVSRWDRSPSVRLTSFASQGAFFATKTSVWEDTTIRVSEYALTQRTAFRKRGEEAPERLVQQLAMRSAAWLGQPVGNEDGDSIEDVTPNEEPGPESRLGEQEAAARRAALAAAALGALSERDRDIVTRRLLAEEPETLKSIGESFGVSDSTVTDWVQRAKAQMKKRVCAVMSEDDAILWGGEWQQPRRREVREAA